MGRLFFGPSGERPRCSIAPIGRIDYASSRKSTERRTIMRFPMFLVALGLPCFVSCSEDTPPGEESDTDTDTDSDTDTDTDTDVSDGGDDIATATSITFSDGKTPSASDGIQ